MRRAIVALALAAAASLAQAQPSEEPPQGEPDAAAEPPGPTPPSVRIDPNAPTSAYDSRVKQSFAAAQAFQGPLDGGWIASARGRDLLQLQLVDKGRGQVEGAWRDLLGGLGSSASGLMDPAETAGGKVEMRFVRADGLNFRLTLRAMPGGRWTGQLFRGDELFDVALRRVP
jgi:hypothetical protein